MENTEKQWRKDAEADYSIVKNFGNVNRDDFTIGYMRGCKAFKAKLREEVEKRIIEMEQALKELPKTQHERVKGNLSTCDYIIRLID